MTNSTTYRFPFGRLVTPCPPSATDQKSLFVLGAYPSALHVKWTPPEGHKPIAAMAVDNEPTPFWTGDDQDERIEAWQKAVNWNPSCGTVTGTKHLNGPSGDWVAKKLLAPLKTDRKDAWITDCLDTYRASVNQAAALAERYAPFAEAMGHPLHVLPPHPSENAIAAEAKSHHLERLKKELLTARPELIVTLGNAALRVAAGLVEVADAPTKLSHADYGRTLEIRLDGRVVKWLPLAHPAAPKPYQDAHDRWVASFAGCGSALGVASLVPRAKL